MKLIFQKKDQNKDLGPDHVQLAFRQKVFLAHNKKLKVNWT